MDRQPAWRSVMNELCSAQVGIESSRITERQKCASELRELLKRPDVIEYITQCTGMSRGSHDPASRSQCSSGSGTTWPYLLWSVLAFIGLETEAIRRLEETGSVSAQAQTLRKTRKMNICDTLKVFVRASSKGLSNLQVNELLNHMTSILQNDRLTEWFGQEYSHILISSILTAPYILIQITSHKLEELIGLHCELFLSPPASLDQSLLATCVNTLVFKASLQCDLPTAKLFNFFAQILPKICQMKTKQAVLMLTTLNRFGVFSAQNCRGRFCKLGEDMMADFTPLWSKCHPAILEPMVEFFRSQVKVHHPQGAYTDETGAWAANDCVWKRSLRNLFELLMNDIETASTRVKCKGEVGLKFEVVDLTADVMRQILYLESSSQAPHDTTEPRGKRPKRQTVWSRVIEGLSSEGPATVLWLQLVAWLLSKWSGSLPEDETQPLLSLLVRLLLEVKREEWLQWVLVCLQVLALSPSSPATCRELWAKAWHTTIKLLNAQGVHQQGYCLLTILLQRRLVECDLEPWRLFHSALNQPTKPVVSLLCGILCDHTIPEALPTFVAMPTATPTGRDFPLRSHLLHFLIPTTEEWTGHLPGSHDPSTSNATSTIDRSPVALLAHVLVALTQRSCHSARIPLVKQLMLPVSHSVYVSELLDPTRQSGLAGSSARDGDQFEVCWARIEGLYLQSTFDQPLTVPCLDQKQPSKVTLSKESTIASLQALLLDLLAQRSKQLLKQQVVSEVAAPVRERAKVVSTLLASLTYHCGLVVNVLLLLAHCQAFKGPDQLRRALAIRTLPDLLKRISTCLKDPVWNELERSVYYKTATSAITALQSLIHFPHLTEEGGTHSGGLGSHFGLPHQLSSSVNTALQVVAKVFSLTLPVELLETVCFLAEGNWPFPPSPPSRCSSTFSFGTYRQQSSTTSLTSHPPTSTSASPGSYSPSIDDDIDLGEGSLATSDRTDETTVTNLSDFISSSFLSGKSACQLAATEFLCRLRMAFSLVDPSQNVQQLSQMLKKTLTSLLDVEGSRFAAPFQIQVFFKICEVFGSSLEPVDIKVVDAIFGAFGMVMTAHIKNPCILCESLRLLSLLVPHFITREDITYSHQCCIQLLQAFWVRYGEGRLPASVRIELAKLLQILLEAGRGSPCFNSLIVKEDVTLREAMVCIISDPDHAVRLHMASAVTTLFLSDKKPCILLPLREQMTTFKQISDMLHSANLTSSAQDELSTEDESVNRVGSLIATLQHIACTSPGCEVRVVSMLVIAVGQGNIPVDLVCKALSQVASYLGYVSVREFLEDVLISVLLEWMEQHFPLANFPAQLFLFDTQEDFFRAYAPKLVPHFVFQCNRSALEMLSHMISTPIAHLLRESLPGSMVLILTCYASSDEGRGDKKEVEKEERGGGRTVASARDAHNLLVEYLSKEVVSQDLSVDVFVVELLSRLLEPPGAGSHLSRYSLPSDPQPCGPCFSSHTVRATLDYMPTCYGSSAEHCSFVRLLSRRKDHIQKILISLAVQVETTHRSHKKRRLFLAYSLFVSLVCRELKEEFDSTQAFIVMDIIHTIVRIVSPGEVGELGRELFLPCCDTLLEVCKATMDACPEELCKYLHTLAATLIPYAQQSTKEGEKALSVLTSIMATLSPELLADHVTTLDPFPNVKGLKQLHEKQQMLKEAMGAVSLSQEIERFLSVGMQSRPFSRVEGLGHLCKMLHTSKLELTPLRKEGGSVVVRLIQGLLGVCCSSSGSGGGGTAAGSKMETEVAKCLGEIGPMDLNCIAMPPLRDNYISFDCDKLPAGSSWIPSVRRTIKILYCLTALLKDPHVSVVQASGECLRAVLATKSGAAVLQKVEKELAAGADLEWAFLLEPFKQHHKKKRTPSATLSTPDMLSTFPAAMNQPNLWLPSDRCSHRQWLTHLVATLITSEAVTDEVLLLLRPVCLVKVEVCEELFPLLVHDILASCGQDFRPLFSEKVRTFFATVRSQHQLPPSPPSHPHTDHTPTPQSDSIKTMLNMVMYLRTVPRPKKGKGPSTPWDNNFWLDVDFLDVAVAAQFCSAYFTSLLCIEIWSKTMQYASDGCNSNSTTQPMEVDNPTDESSDQSSVTCSPTASQDVQRLLLEAYSHIGEPDSLYGACHSSASDDTRVSLYEYEGKWHKSLSAYSLQMQLPGAACEPKLVESLSQLGLTHVLNMYLQGASLLGGVGSGEGVAEYRYEAAWRCSMWEQGGCSMPSLSGRGTFHQSVFNAIVALRDAEPNLFRLSFEQARGHVMSELRSTGLESVYSVYPFLSRLLCVLELEEAGSELSLPTEDAPFLQDWKLRLPFLDSDFQFVEPVLALRCSVLHCLLSSTTSTDDGSEEEGGSPPLSVRRKTECVFAALSDTLLTLATRAREASKYQVAESALFSLRHLQSQRQHYRVPLSLHPELTLTLDFEAAKLSWSRGEAGQAMAQLRTLLHSLENNRELSNSLYPSALCLYGSWLAETRSESPSVIMKRYLQRSVDLMEEQGKGHGNQEALVKAYVTLGRYADAQYQRIMRHLASPSYDAKKQLLDRNKLELKKLKSQFSTQDHLRSRHIRTLSAQIDQDEIAMTNVLNDKQQFLEKALKNYLMCLQHGDEHDLRVFRLCALWFANASSPPVNQLVKEGAARLESRKFLPLMYQLAARMSAITLNSDPFQQILHEVMLRASMEHPHHCLCVILALSNASKDDMYPLSGHVTGTKNPGRTTGRLSKKPSTTQNYVDEDKVQAAQVLLTKLRSKNPSVVQSVEQLSNAYIDLAYHDVTAYRKQRTAIKLPNSCPLLKLGGGRLKDIPVLTIDIEVDHTCRYDNIISVESFDSFFSLAGGVNLPKILSCRGSDGRRRKQLVKGRDDLRQDAVMQQVFKLVNRLLAREPSTSKRGLNIRSYKVIPLSQRSGVVEWCEGTQPLGEYLIGIPSNPQLGAHYRYRPNDLSSAVCRKKLSSAGSDRKTSKYAVYLEICKSFKPVFHHFFMENFSQPPQWFERRLAYTRSVAASSIIGYLVGLGDRHVQNILIDTNTAEFIHIDLGVAFEQGKTLPTPETVPFRLTRDMVDGMGYARVEGVFRRCCEETLALMRAHQEELRTIVEVLLYDPLHQWTVSPLKAMSLQQRAQEDATTATNTGDVLGGAPPHHPTKNGSTNKMAERVLLRLQEKLEGIEDSVPLSVGGQVTNLIQEASDPANLCLLFPGWQPWI